MKRIFLATLMILCSSFLFAQKFEAICETGQTLKYSISDENAVVISYSGYYRNLVIPSTVTYNNHQYNVTSIGERTFSDYYYLTSVMIPESVTSIGDYAFYHCTGLTSITIPESVTSIGDYAFSNCTGLTSVTIPESVTKIGDYAFSCCHSLTSITIPESVTSIGDYAFYGCINLTSVMIPESVTSIGDYAFSNCTGLTSVTIPESVTKIGDYAFSCCHSLTSITIPESVTSIGDYAFYGCINLTSVMIPESVTSIGDYAFLDCHSLTSITIPESVTSIGEGTFCYCNCLMSVMIPKSVTTIGDYAFSCCHSLTSITIPESVTSIGDYAFSSCSVLPSITIPESVTSIGDAAFAHCNGLKTITCYAQKVPSCKRFFADEKMYDSIILYVPCRCLQDYQNDNVFGKFSHIECIAEETILQSNDVTFEPETYSADFSFPKIESVASYELTIKKGDEFICALTFNADGVLQGINFSELKSDFAGFKFNVTGLTPATTYNYLLQGKSESNVVLKEFSGTFTTQGTDTDNLSTGISSTEFSDCISVVNNQILVNGVAPEYVITVLGQKVANQNLQTGIYFVVVDGQNLKVSIP